MNNIALPDFFVAVENALKRGADFSDLLSVLCVIQDKELSNTYEAANVEILRILENARDRLSYFEK